MVKDLNKTMKIVLMVCAIVLVVAVAGSMIYYFAFAKPGNERAKWEAELDLEREKLEEEYNRRIEELKWEKEKMSKEEEQKERSEKQEEEQTEALREYRLYRCLEDAFDTYIERWNEKCKELGEPDDCALSFDTAELFDKYLDEAEEQCFKLYGPD